MAYLVINTVTGNVADMLKLDNFVNRTHVNLLYLIRTQSMRIKGRYSKER